MTALLKAMGVIVWGLAGVGLLVIGGIVGYKVLRTGSVHVAPALPPTLVASPADPLPAPEMLHAPDTPTVAAASARSPSRGPSRKDARDRFSVAAARGDWDSVIEYGEQLNEDGAADPDDLARVAFAFSSTGDCPSAMAWVDKTTAALEGRPPGATVSRVRQRCGPAPIAVPTPRLGAGGGRSGDLEIQIGERFFGFSEYTQAVRFLLKGNEEGNLARPDEAYVYLGRSYLALGQYDRACAAFDGLAQVSNINDRVRRLWLLYADTHCRRQGRGP